MRTIAIQIDLFAALGIGALLARPFLAGGAGELKVGECFDIPSLKETVEDVQHHPCTDPHGGEVYFGGDLVAARDAPYPTDPVIESEVAALCVPSFDTVHRLHFDTDPTWSFGYFYPHPDSWADGDRGRISYAPRLDDAPTAVSIRKP